VDKKKHKKYKRITLEQARALWEAGVECERRWEDDKEYCSVTKIWGPYGHGGNMTFYQYHDGIFFRVEVE